MVLTGCEDHLEINNSASPDNPDTPTELTKVTAPTAILGQAADSNFGTALAERFTDNILTEKLDKDSSPFHEKEGVMIYAFNNRNKQLIAYDEVESDFMPDEMKRLILQILQESSM